MDQSRKQLNQVLDFLVSFHGLDATSETATTSLSLPGGLRDLYQKHANWTGASFHLLHWEESLSVSDGKVFGIDCPSDWVVFSQEREGVWLAVTPQSNEDDSELAICSRSGSKKLSSLNLFLVWILLQESVWVAEHERTVNQGIDNDEFWKSEGFSDLIDCEFDGGEGFVQLKRKFRLSDDSDVIAHGDSQSSQLSSCKKMEN